MPSDIVIHQETVTSYSVSWLGLVVLAGGVLLILFVIAAIIAGVSGFGKRKK